MELNDNFYKWFAGSKVVDKNGKPLICLHRTNKEFNTFDINKSSYNNTLGRGIYFVTKNSDSIQMQDYGNITKECYLKIENPFDLDKIYPKSFYKGWFSDKLLDYTWEMAKTFLGKTNLSGYDFLLYLGYGRGKVIELQEFMDVYKIFQEHGYDGFVSDNNTMWTCFNPNQIKSVDNNGNWSTSSDNIYETLNQEIERYL